MITLKEFKENAVKVLNIAEEHFKVNGIESEKDFLDEIHKTEYFKETDDLLSRISQRIMMRLMMPVTSINPESLEIYSDNVLGIEVTYINKDNNFTLQHFTIERKTEEDFNILDSDEPEILSSIDDLKDTDKGLTNRELVQKLRKK